MNYQIQQKIDELQKAIRENAPKDAVSFHLFINGFETRVEITVRTPEQFKACNRVMRNLAGDSISD